MLRIRRFRKRLSLRGKNVSERCALMTVLGATWMTLRLVSMLESVRRVLRRNVWKLWLGCVVLVSVTRMWPILLSRVAKVGLSPLKAWATLVVQLLIEVLVLTSSEWRLVGGLWLRRRQRSIVVRLPRLMTPLQGSLCLFRFVVL